MKIRALRKLDAMESGADDSSWLGGLEGGNLVTVLGFEVCGSGQGDSSRFGRSGSHVLATVLGFGDLGLRIW